MMLATPPASLDAVVRRVIRAPVARVFAAWSDPATMATWFRAGSFADSDVTLDFRVGGAYRILMHPDGSTVKPSCGGEAGKAYWHEGVYTEIRAPERLGFTWRSHGVAVESEVGIDFRALADDVTEIVLRHRRLPDAASIANHTGGWHEILANCAARLAGAAGAAEDGLHLDLIMAAPAAAVYAALTTTAGVRGWWTATSEVGAGIGALATVRFNTTHKVMRVEALTPDAEVRWRVIDCEINAPGITRRDEWLGTLVAFHLEATSPTTTRLRFAHHGLVPAMQCHGICTTGWQHFLASLQQYVETGTGTPFDGGAGHACHGAS